MSVHAVTQALGGAVFGSDLSLPALYLYPVFSSKITLLLDLVSPTLVT
jgi:hypothetical protein